MKREIVEQSLEIIDVLLAQISALEQSQEDKPSDKGNYEKSIRLLYRAYPCINNGIQDEQLAEDIQELLMSLPDRNINLWYCPVCKTFVDPIDVTYEETHDVRSGGCGNSVNPTIAMRDNKIPITKSNKIKP